MQVSCYLVVQGVPYSHNSQMIKPGTIRITKKKPPTASDEIALELNLSIPDALFTKPILQANITVPEGAPLRQTMTAEIGEEIAREIEKRMGFAVTISVPESESPGDMDHPSA